MTPSVVIDWRLFPCRRPGNSTEPLSSKTEFGILGEEGTNPAVWGIEINTFKIEIITQRDNEEITTKLTKSRRTKVCT